MNTTQLLIVCVTLLLIVLVRSASREASPCTPADLFDGLKEGDKLAIHLADGQSITGTVVDTTPGRVRLGDAVLRGAGQEQQLGGRVRVPTSSAIAVQEL